MVGAQHTDPHGKDAGQYFPQLPGETDRRVVHASPTCPGVVAVYCVVSTATQARNSGEWPKEKRSDETLRSPMTHVVSTLLTVVGMLAATVIALFFRGERYARAERALRESEELFRRGVSEILCLRS
jgi:hypothetical protein